MLIARALLDELIAHALQEAPNECCGLIGYQPATDGEPPRALRVHRARNYHQTVDSRFSTSSTGRV